MTKHMDKRIEYIELVRDVKNCSLCSNMITNPHTDCNEKLINDSHGLDTDIPYINLWNLWNGNLDAEIMVIGQDFGSIEDLEKILSGWKSGEYSNQTDVNIKLLFDEVFSIDVDADSAPLYFTNMANCYRCNSSTGAMHSGWLPICANKFMGRLIKIIEPKIIIALGQKTFEAMFCLEGLPINCTPKQENKHSNRFEDIMSARYKIDLNGKSIDVFPVYHPGANSKRNRKWEEQISDWQRIKECYDRK